MSTKLHIQAHLATLPPHKQKDMQALHNLIVALYPTEKQWFFDGLNESGKPIANPTIGYGVLTMSYAKGKTRDIFKLGISSTSTGISIHILGLTDKLYLSKTFAATIGKATITGYCIKFKTMEDVDLYVMKNVVKYGMDRLVD